MENQKIILISFEHLWRRIEISKLYGCWALREKRKTDITRKWLTYHLLTTFLKVSYHFPFNSTTTLLRLSHDFLWLCKHFLATFLPLSFQLSYNISMTFLKLTYNFHINCQKHKVEISTTRTTQWSGGGFNLPHF